MKGMCRKIFIAAMLISVALMAYGQDYEPMEAIAFFYGAVSAEQLDEDDVDRMEALIRHPVDINAASISKMVESGLFSQYQAASIASYIQNHGQVMSMTELAAIDGIGKDFAARLAPFISIRTGAVGPKRAGFCGEVCARGGWKPSFDGGSRWSAGVKLNAETAWGWSAGIAMSKTYSDKIDPKAAAAYLAWEGRRSGLKIIAGEFGLRFGQGLALWTGMGMSGISTVSSLERRPSGLVTSSSFSANYTLTGLAARYSPGKFVISCGLALPGIRNISGLASDLHLMPFADCTYLLDNGQIALSAYLDALPFGGVGNGQRCKEAKVSLSERWCIDGHNIFSELAFDFLPRAPAGLIGYTGRACEGLRLGAVVRYYPSEYQASRSNAPRSLTKCSNEHGATFSGDFSFGKTVELERDDEYLSSVSRHTGSFSLDCAYFPQPKSKDDPMSRQLKLSLVWNIQIDRMFALKFTSSCRVRTWGKPLRGEIRADLVWRLMEYYASLRADVVKCDGVGLLGYADIGWKGSTLAAWLRFGMFCIDSWDDRIYVYERDAPGSFNVPAFSGRGLWTSLASRWKFSNKGSLNLRLALTDYPFMQNKKPGNAELKVQLNWRF